MSGIRFFNMNFADPNYRLATVTVSNNSAESISLVNRDNLFKWESIGSDDSNAITLLVDFGTARTVDTLILTNNNLKNFKLEYLNGSAVWVQLLAETSNAESTYFKQFTPVTTQKVRLTMNTTMTANAEKALQDFIVTQQIGQLAGYPKINFKPDGVQKKKTMLNGKDKFVLSGFSSTITLTFQDYVGNSDRDLFNTLASSTEAFLVWLSGGDATQFVHADLGYRLQDIYLVSVDKGYSHSFKDNLYFSGFNATLTLSETA